MSTRQLSFSIEGPFITRLAREKMESGDFNAAYNLIWGCTESDGLSEPEHRTLVYDILSGRKKITGTYPNNDYGVIDDPNFESDLIGAAFSALKSKYEETSQSLEETKAKFEFIQDDLYESRRSVFCDLNEAYVVATGESLFEYNEGQSEQQSMPPHMSSMLESFMQQARIERAQSDKDSDTNYGWLRPDGVFFPVPWGEHETWAVKHLDEYYPKESCPHLYKTVVPANGESVDIYGGDVLRLNLGWALLHSPYRGVAEITRSELKPLTGPMRSFLFEYYTSRGLNAQAAKYEKEE